MKVYEHIASLALDFKEFGVREVETYYAFHVTVENLFTHNTADSQLNLTRTLHQKDQLTSILSFTTKRPDTKTSNRSPSALSVCL